MPGTLEQSENVPNMSIMCCAVTPKPLSHILKSFSLALKFTKPSELMYVPPPPRQIIGDLQCDLQMIILFTPGYLLILYVNVLIQAIPHSKQSNTVNIISVTGETKTSKDMKQLFGLQNFYVLDIMRNGY